MIFIFLSCREKAHDKKEFSHDSVMSRAAFKKVYRFGIPNSDPQTLKSVKINPSKNRQILTIRCCIATRAMF